MHGWHLVDHIENHGLIADDTLHVVGVISNPVRYHSRYRLARKWIYEMASTRNVRLHIVETAFGDRHHELKKVCHEVKANFLPLRNKSEIWIKENMINLAVKRLLPIDWRYMAWVDADVVFRNPDWALETVQALQHYPVVQPWQSAINLGPNGNINRVYDSTGYKFHMGIPDTIPYNGDPYFFGHTGYAWACTRAFWENTGGLIDFAILGSADHHMALAMRGIVEKSMSKNKLTPGFVRRCYEWQKKAMQITSGVVGYTNGRIEHQFHGPMAKRYYRERWKILYNHKYDPDTDLMYDDQGMVKLVGKPALEHEIRLYNRSRHEDSIEET